MLQLHVEHGPTFASAIATIPKGRPSARASSHPFLAHSESLDGREQNIPHDSRARYHQALCHIQRIRGRSSEQAIDSFAYGSQIADRLCASIGQDILDCLFSRSTLEPLTNRRPVSSQTFRPFIFFSLALAYNGKLIVLNLVYFSQLFGQCATPWSWFGKSSP